MDSIPCPLRVETEQLAILMETECQICKNIPTYSLQIGTIQPQLVCLTTVSGGMEPFQSTIGMRRIPCNSTNPYAVIQEVTVKAIPSCAMKTLLGTFVLMDSTTTKTVKLTVPIQTTTVMPIAQAMTTTAMVSPMKIQTDGTRTVTVCPTVGKRRMVSMQQVHQTLTAQTVIQTVMV